MTTPHNPEAPEVILADSIPASAGSPAAVPVQVRHRGRRPARIRVTIFGLDSRWVPQPLDLGVLQPGDTAAIKLSIVPERGAMGARYPFTIAAEASSADGRGRPVVGVAESVLALDSAERISMTIVPSTPEGTFSKGFRVEITNPSDRERTFTLVPDSAAGVTARLSAQSVTVPAERTVAVKGRVHVKKPTVFGGHNTHTFTVAAQGTGAPEWAEGTMRSTPLVGKGVRTVVGLVLVVALWATLAIVFIPKISGAFKPKNDASVSTVQSSEGADGSGSDGGAGGDGAQGSGDGSQNGDGDGSGQGSGDGNGSGNGTGAGTGGHPAGGYQLSGTVTGSGANGANVTLAPVSLASAGDDGSLPPVQSGSNPNALRGQQGAAFVTAANDPIGKIPGPLAAVTPNGFRTTTVLTKEKGEFTFAGVTAPGFYLLTVAKAGYQTQRFLINSVSLASPQPLKVELQPGKGKLSGMVTGPGGSPLGAATIVVTDGTVTLQTSSVSASTHSGTPGSWSLDQVSTPGTYLVTASSPGLGAASTLVSLDASGTATVNLSLQAGQTSITGKVSGADSLGNVGGLGGITVTATNGDITRTATTVTSAALRGAYVLPNLPTPGSYTLTISGAGFKTQTREVNLPAGSGNVVIDATLSRADAVVAGLVTGLDANGKAEGGLAGVGLTLASNDVTLKTMSTSGATAGSFQFTGVAPGSYVLTAVQFGRTAASATVEVTAGTPQTVNLVLKADIGAELPATAHIRGQVADSRTGGPLTCDRALETVAASDCVATVTVTAPKDPADESKGTVTYTTKATAALNFVYTIPDIDDPDHAGLPPGLYTVNISAPGYEDTVTHVQVAEGQTVPAPPASMPALGIISGTVTTRVDKPAKASCVLAVPVGVSLPKTLPTSCTVSTDGNTCTATGISGAQPCALTSLGGQNETPLGTFQVRGLKHGRYQMVLISQDPEYVYTVGAVPIVTLELGADGQFNAVLDRLGRINVNVVKVDPQTGSVNGVSGATVSATKVSGDGVATATPVTTDANGIAILKGLNGSYKVQTTFTDNGQSITVDATSDPTGLNQTVPVTLFLAKKSGPLVGRVTTDGGGTQASPVAGVTVTINGTVGYQGANASTGSVQVVTKANGCYAVVPDDWSPVNNPTLASPDCAAGTFLATDSPAVGGVGAVGTLKNLLTGQPATLINDRIDASVAALPKTAPDTGTWTEPYPVTGQGITDCTSGCSANTRAIPTINVKPSAMSASGLWLYVAGPNGFAAPVPSSVHINVLSKPSASGGVTLAPPAGSVWIYAGSGPVANSQQWYSPLTFTDSQFGGTAGQALPGRYKLQVSMDGFTTENVDLVCRFQSTCIFTAPNGTGAITLRLSQLPSISVKIGPLTGPDVDWTKASVSQTSGPALGAVTVFNSNDPKASHLTFNGDETKVVAAGTSYSFSLSVPGYGTSAVSVDCGTDYTTTSPSCTATATLASLPYFPAVTMQLDPDTEPGAGGAVLSPATATATIAPNPGASILVSVDANGGISWKDSRSGVLDGQVIPADYTITFHRAGYVDTLAYLSCTSADCKLFSDSGHASEISTVTMPMLPQPKITVKATLLAAHDSGPFTFGNSSFTVYRVVGGTETKISTVSLGLGAGDIADTGGGKGTVVTADVSWLDTAQPFAGIAGQAKYRVVANIDGFEQGTGDLDCTVAATTCQDGEVALTSNPTQDPSDLKVTKLPNTTSPVVFNVAGPAGVPNATLTEDTSGNGSLTWRQGSALPNVVAPGNYVITATLANYQSAVVGAGNTTTPTTQIQFSCNVAPTPNDCDFPQIVMVRTTTLNIVLEDSAHQAPADADLVLKQNTTVIDSPTTHNGSATFAGRSTTSLDTSATPWADISYTLDVKAAGFQFASGLDKDSTNVSCSNGASTVSGLRLLPGGTTTCTVTLTGLGAITGTTAWQIKSLTGGDLNAEAIGNIGLKATLLKADGSATTTSFTTSSGSNGSFTITGGKGTGEEGLGAGNWKIETTGTSGKFDSFSGVVTIDANSYALVETPAAENVGSLTRLTVSVNETVTITLIPVKVNLDVKFMSGTSQTAPPDAKITLTDKDSPANSWVCIAASAAIVPTGTTDNPAGGGSKVCSMSSNTVRFIKLPPGSYSAAVDYTNAGYSDASTDFTVDPTGQTKELEFSPGAQVSTITGALADSNGTPITTMPTGSKVELWKWTCPEQDSAHCLADDFTGQPLVDNTLLNGQFSLTNVINGQYRVVVISDWYAQGTSDQLNVVAGNPWTGITIRLRATAATSLKFKVNLGDGSHNAELNGAQVKLKPTVQPRQAANPELSGTSDATGVVSIPAAVLTGTYEAVVTLNSEAVPFPLTSTSTVTIADTDDGSAVDKSGTALSLDGVPTTLSLSWTAADLACAAPPADASSIALTLSQDNGGTPINATAAPSAVVAAATSKATAPTTYLPAGKSYSFGPAASTTWGLKTSTDGDFSIAAGAASKSADAAIKPTGSATQALASVKVKLGSDTTDTATVSTTVGATTTPFTSDGQGNGVYTACLAPDTDYTVSATYTEDANEWEKQGTLSIDANGGSETLQLTLEATKVSAKLHFQVGTTATQPTDAELTYGTDPAIPVTVDPNGDATVTGLVPNRVYTVTATTDGTDTYSGVSPSTITAPPSGTGTVVNITLTATTPAPTAHDVSPAVTLTSGTPATTTVFTITIGTKSYAGSFTGSPLAWTAAAPVSLDPGTYTPTVVTADAGTASISGSFTVDSDGDVSSNTLAITSTP